jgi:hypothetical protein
MSKPFSITPDKRTAFLRGFLAGMSGKKLNPTVDDADVWVAVQTNGEPVTDTNQENWYYQFGLSFFWTLCEGQKRGALPSIDQAIIAVNGGSSQSSTLSTAGAVVGGAVGFATAGPAGVLPGALAGKEAGEQAGDLFNLDFF